MDPLHWDERWTDRSLAWLSLANTSDASDGRPRLLAEMLGAAARVDPAALDPRNRSQQLLAHVATSRRQLQLLLQSYYASDTTLEVLLYSLLFVLGALGNLFLLAQLLGWKQRKSRANLLFLHLTLADLLVVLVIIPKEIFWRLTFSWRASEALCKLLHYLGNFSLYLSSFMIVCIALNRFRAFVNPLSFHREHEHNLLLVLGSYLLSSLMSIPQVRQLPA